ncbi:hypothetical protein MUN35_08535, partial [Hafnia paralvei]|uniref:hypothetical protein n=1 Tax=Hafnia paralvei TaxID=546367 RepID=UPI001FFEB387
IKSSGNNIYCRGCFKYSGIIQSVSEYGNSRISLAKIAKNKKPACQSVFYYVVSPRFKPYHLLSKGGHTMQRQAMFTLCRSRSQA